MANFLKGTKLAKAYGYWLNGMSNPVWFSHYLAASASRCRGRMLLLLAKWQPLPMFAIALHDAQ